MKPVGLIGNLDRETPLSYWRIINHEVHLRCGGEHTGKLTVHSFDAFDLKRLLDAEDWPRIVELFVQAAKELQGLPVEGLAICGSALNPAAEALQSACGTRVIRISRAMFATLQIFRYTRVAVIGTKTATEDQMWRDDLAGIQLIEPTVAERDWFEQLTNILNRQDTQVQTETNHVMCSLRKRGTKAVVLADSVLNRWVNLEESLLPVFDATEIHAWSTAGWMLADEGQLLSAPPCVIREN